MIKWKDTTSYSRGERGKVTPRSWTCEIGEFNLCVTRHIHHDPTAWISICDGVLHSGNELESKDLEDAKQEAIDEFVAIFQEALLEISKYEASSGKKYQ